MGKEAIKNFKGLSKMDILGVFIYYILLIGFIIGLIYWGYFSGEVSKLPIIDGNGLFYFFMIFMGLWTFGYLWYHIAEFFYPLTKEEIKNKKKKRKQFREALIKHYEKKIKKLKDKK